MRAAAVLLVVAGAVPLSLAGAGNQANFTSVATAVVVDVAVTEGTRPVSGLTKDDFVVTDNGVPQQIQDFTHERLPIDVHISVDVSGSMNDTDRQIIDDAIAQVGKALTAGDRVSTAVFWSHISERAPLGPPPITLSIADIGRNTAVLDAMLLALVRPELAGRRQFSIFMTDGLDTASYFDESVVVATAKHATGPMTVVLAPDRAPHALGGTLRSIAVQTGGEVITLRNRSQLRESFTRALDNFRSSYAVRYFPAGVGSTGWHSINVSVKKGRYTIRARKGYSATRPRA